MNIIHKILSIGIFRLALIASILDIVIFVNFNDSMNKQEFKLMFYVHIFIIVMMFINFGWKKHKDNLTRSLLIALGFYWLFEIIMQSIAVIDFDLKVRLYTGKNINYILSLACGGSLLVLPTWNKLKLWLKNF